LVGKQAKCPRCKTPFAVTIPTPPPQNDDIRVVSDNRPSRPKVFLSHSHQDRAFVQQTLEPLLEDHEIEAWWSRRVPGGAEWEPEVRRHLHESDWFLLVMSPQSAASEWVKKEVGWFLADRPQRLLPVLLQKCDPGQIDSRLPNRQFIDFTQNPAEASRKLIADVLRQLHKETGDQQTKVEQLSEDNVRLRGEVATLDLQRKKLEDQLNQVLEFDGNWTHQAPKGVPPFRPPTGDGAAIVAVLNLMGGVGKSTLTANLAATLWGMQPKQWALLVDLDYQGTLTTSCLKRKTVGHLRQQGRRISTLFASDYPDGKMVVRCREEIDDDRGRGTDCYIVAGDDDLAAAEAQALVRWLTGRSQADVRYLLRSALHSAEVQSDYHWVLLDCPPRLTTACVNALTACDYVLIPVLIDERSTEGAPRLLRWLRDRRKLLFPELRGVGVVANKTRGKTRDALTAREKEDWSDLMQDCQAAWQGETECKLFDFDTVVPLFTETAMARRFPASYQEMQPTFLNLVNELKSHLAAPVGVKK
jgi:chromosome partitioning protein